MKTFILSMALLLCVCASVEAQQCCPGKVEIFGGYSYLNLSPKTDRIPADSMGNRFDGRLDQHGFGISVMGNISNKFGIVGDFSHNMKDDSRRILDVKTETRTNVFLFGPRFSSRSDDTTAFIHALVGGLKRRVVSEKLKLSNTDLTLAFGGGLELNTNKHVGVRLLQVDYLPSRGEDDVPGDGKRWSHNFRIQAGLVFRFGN
jgi:hypothetical protein